MLIWRVIFDFLKDKDYRELLTTTVLVLAIGAGTFHYLEGWSILDSVYFCVITLTTIGYGDLTPKTDIGKIFNMIYIVIGLGLILTFIRTVYDHYSITKAKQKRNE
ncbi:MAG: two pore domain potassium channel family protein [Bacteroidetes bacterium]|nr:two pore domain potassium channel family protein [Bacteroidota bacterium]